MQKSKGKHKIVEKELEYKGNKIEVDLDVYISPLTEVKKEVALSLIGGVINGKYEKYFDKPLTGKYNITYPLDVIVEGEIKDENSIGGLLWEVAQVYNAIYKEEDKSTKVKPGYIKGMLNRNTTDGKYGIWGHDIGDLVFEAIEIYENGTINFFIGS